MHRLMLGPDASLLYSLLFACSTLTDSFGTASLWSVVLISAGPVTASLVQLDWLGKKACGRLCVIQQVLLFIVGLFSWRSCHLGASASHLAVCAAFWLLAHKEVKLSHALSLQAAETAIAIGFRLSQVLPGQNTCGGIACIAACYLAIGLLAPAAVYHGSSSWDESHGQATREASCSSTKSNNSRAAVMYDQPGMTKQDSAGNMGNPPAEDLVLRVCELVAAGVVSPWLVQQQLELAAAKRVHEGGSVPSSASHSSISSSGCASTRPSTSFSSASLGLDPSATFWVHSGVHLAALHGPSDAALHHHSLEQPHHLHQHQPHHLHKLPAPSVAHSLAHHQLWPLHLEAFNPCTATTQTGPELHVQLLGRHRPGRSRTAVNLLGPAEREELPPIVEAAHEGTQHQLNSPTQDLNRCPSLHFEHKTWPPATPLHKQQGGASGVAGPHNSGVGRVSVEGVYEARQGQQQRQQQQQQHETGLVYHDQTYSTASGSGGSRSSSSSSKVAASVTCRHGELTDSRGESCSATEAGLQELVQASGGRRSGGRGNQAQLCIPGQTGQSAEAEAWFLHYGSCPSSTTVPACLEPAHALACSSSASPGARQQQLEQQHQQQQQCSSASGGEAHATGSVCVREEVVEGGRVDGKQACKEADAEARLMSLDAAGAMGPAALQQHGPSSAQGSSDANTLIHMNSKLSIEGGGDASRGSRDACACSSTSSNGSGQAAAAATTAAGGAAKVPRPPSGDHQSSSKMSGGPVPVGSLKPGSPIPSGPGPREASGGARGELAREDLMGAWLDQQILLSKAQSSDSRAVADDGHTPSTEQAALPHEPGGQQQQGTRSYAPSTQGDSPSDSTAPAPTAVEPPLEPQRSAPTPHPASEPSHQVATSGASQFPDPAVPQAAAPKAQATTSNAARTHRNDSFCFDHPRPAKAPSSSPLRPPAPAQSSSTQVPHTCAHSAAQALVGNRPHPSPATHLGGRGTSSAQSSHRSSLEHPQPRGSLLDQARDKDGDSLRSRSSTSSRRVSFDLAASGQSVGKASSFTPPPDHADNPGKATSATLARHQPTSLPQQQQHQHQHMAIHPSQPLLNEQQQQQQQQHLPNAAGSSAPLVGTGPAQPGQQHATSSTGDTHQGASLPDITSRGHGNQAHMDHSATPDCPPCEPSKTPGSTGDPGKDAHLSNAPASPPTGPPQEQQDGSLARRFPPQKEMSSLLKNVLPDSVRANLQSIPAKAADQQQPTAYAGSTQLGNRKIRPTGESTELDVENTIIANRRYLDASKVLLEEIQVNKVLGFGSMGMVYFGVLWDTKVVVKMIEHGAGLLGKEQNRGKLARTEAVLSRMLLHPNVVVTYDCCTGMMDATRLQVSGTPSRALRGKAGRQRQMTVMVQEFCDAGTLSDALQKRRHGLDMANPGYAELVMQLALDIANGLKYMHSLRVLHVDLKAENILLTHSSAGTAPTHNRPGHLTAKVADLGLALVLSMDSDEVQSGIHGTVSHMPPEAMRGTTFSMATDVYSFGVVIWELVTQGKPFAGLKAHQVVEAVCDFNERPPWPEQLHPKFVALRDLACWCWDASPCNRPSIFEVVNHLHEIIDPSLAMQKSSEGAGSVVTDESDELELALKSQSKLPATTTRQLPHLHANEHTDPLRANKDAAAEAAAHAHLPRTKRSSSSSRRRSSIGSKRASSGSGVGHLQRAESHRQVTGLQAIMSAGPPPDMLSRMLYYLAQVPPQRDQLQQVEAGGGIVRLAAAVDMSGLRAR